MDGSVLVWLERGWVVNPTAALRLILRTLPRSKDSD